MKPYSNKSRCYSAAHETRIEPGSLPPLWRRLPLAREARSKSPLPKGDGPQGQGDWASAGRGKPRRSLHFVFRDTCFYHFLLHETKSERCFLLFFVFCILFVDRLHAPAIQFKHRRFGVVRQQFTNSAHEELDKQRKAVCLTFFVLITLFSVPSPASPPVLRFSCSIPRYSMALLCYSVCRSLWVTSPYIPLGMNWFSC